MAGAASARPARRSAGRSAGARLLSNRREGPIGSIARLGLPFPVVPVTSTAMTAVTVTHPLPWHQPRHMAHLAAGAGFALAVIVDADGAVGGPLGQLGDVVADQVGHYAV